MNPFLSLLCRLSIVAAFAVAVAATGIGHRLPNGFDDQAQAFVLAGGDLADFCGDLDGDGLPDRTDCPACHIAAIAGLPAPDVMLHDANFAFVAKVVAPRESRALRLVLDPALGMRAPPLA